MRSDAWRLGLATAAFIAVTLCFGRPIAGLWNSPDETSNAFWAERVAQGLPLGVHDVIVGLGRGAVHPRSMAVVGDALVPGSFPGLILLYGALKRLFGIPLYMLTPLFTLLAACAFGATVRRLFDAKTGAWAAFLFLLHPALLYYGARGLFHNVLFVDLLIISIALFTLRPFRKWKQDSERLDDVLGGFIFGWAIVTRASEAVWAVPAFLAFLPLAGKDRWRRLGWAALGAALPLFLALSVNASVYGAPFATAYTPLPADAGDAIVAPAAAAASRAWLPFGFHPRAALRNAWDYGLKLFWWQSLLAAAGFVWWCRRAKAAPLAQKTYAIAALAVAAWLAAFYGSWRILDRFDPGTVTIGTSYVRYFLPIYVAAIPFAAYALARVAETYKPYRAAALAILCAALGVYASLYVGDESLRAVHRTLYDNSAKKPLLLQAIPPDAVVMTERFDKLLVPERLRIIPAIDDSSFEILSELAHYEPAYWYGLTPTADEAVTLKARAAAHGLVWTEAGTPVQGEALYRFTYE